MHRTADVRVLQERAGEPVADLRLGAVVVVAYLGIRTSSSVADCEA
jgi:hypothetical protein